FIC
ncbi:Lipid A export ATP-binding/permease protein MsbA, partial [Haemophilus influenzae]